MENGTNFFIGHSSSSSSHNSVQNGSGSSSLKWGNYDSTNELFPTAAVESANSFTHTEGNSSLHAITFPYYNNNNGNFHHYYSAVQQENWSPFAGDGSHVHLDPNLMCLKLGKRHYFKDPYSGPGAAASEVGLSTNIIGKRGKPNSYCGIQRGGGIAGPSSSPSSAATGPRCQVDGCHMVLVNAKEYHRRHKVCEMHSKAPRVTVLGLEQRFCQQCSRFHAVSEFDEAKRSCRRRLAGHNERRRKNSHESVISRIHFYDKFVAGTGRWPYLLTSTTTGRALSLLSSESDSLWVSPSDISSRSSAALRELIAEHRASILARQFILGPNSHYHPTNVDLGEPQPAAGANPFPPRQHQTLAAVSSLDRFHDAGTHVTLDLMQASSSAFGFLSTGRKNKEEEEECSLLWKSWEGTNDI